MQVSLTARINPQQKLFLSDHFSKGFASPVAQ